MKRPNKITKKSYLRMVCRLAKNRSLEELEHHHAQLQKREQAALDRGDHKLARRLDVLERVAQDAVFEREFGPVMCPRPRHRRS